MSRSRKLRTNKRKVSRKNKSKRVYKRRNVKQFGGEVSDKKFNELVEFINDHAVKDEAGKYAVEIKRSAGPETTIYYSEKVDEKLKYKKLCLCKVIDYMRGLKYKGIQFWFEVNPNRVPSGFQTTQYQSFEKMLNNIWAYKPRSLNLYKNDLEYKYRDDDPSTDTYYLYYGFELFNPTSYLSNNNKEDSVRGTAAQTFFNRFNEKTINLQEIDADAADVEKKILYIDLLNNNPNAPTAEQSVAAVADEDAEQDT